MPAITDSDLIIDVTETTFAEVVLNADRPVLVEFWATWCPPCRMLGPVLAEIATEYADHLLVVKVDLDAEAGLSRDAKVLAAPTMHVYQDGTLVKSMVGAAPKATLLRELAPFLSRS